MSLSNNQIRLTPILGEYDVDQAQLFGIWDDLISYSVDVIMANRTAVFDYIERDCLYFAAVHKIVEVEPNPVPSPVPVNQFYDTHQDALDDEISPWSVPVSFRGLPMSVPPPPPPPEPQPELIGVAFLTTAELPGTMNLGLFLHPDHRGRGYGRQAIRLLLNWAFDELQCHRIQVRLADKNITRRDTACQTLFSLGFVREGVSRRSLLCPAHSPEDRAAGIGSEYRDVITFAILDSDWIMSQNYVDSNVLPKAMLKSRWDEMFERHEKEREEMLALEERLDSQRLLRRMGSNDTIMLSADAQAEHNQNTSVIIDKGKGRQEKSPTHATGMSDATFEDPPSPSSHTEYSRDSSPIPPPPNPDTQDALYQSLIRRLEHHRSSPEFFSRAIQQNALSDTASSPSSDYGDDWQSYHSLPSTSGLVVRNPDSFDPFSDGQQPSRRIEDDQPHWSDAGSVPRSPSARSSAGSADSWDMWESSSVSSTPSSGWSLAGDNEHLQ